MKERTFSGGVNIGGMTVLVIFTLLCLTIFSVLSLASAQADHRLSQKSLEQTAQYYAADGKAEERLRSVSETLAEAAEESGNESGFWEKAAFLLGEGFSSGDKTFSFQEKINDSMNLSVKLQIVYGDPPKAEVLQWQSVSTVEYEIDDTLTLWDGES